MCDVLYIYPRLFIIRLNIITTLLKIVRMNHVCFIISSEFMINVPLWNIGKGIFVVGPFSRGGPASLSHDVASWIGYAKLHLQLCHSDKVYLCYLMYLYGVLMFVCSLILIKMSCGSIMGLTINLKDYETGTMMIFHQYYISSIL